MARPADWYVLDMDSDPTPGDPARLRQLASRFHEFAESAHRAKVAVESLQGNGAVLTWVGKSGDAFREQFGDFPSQVNKLYQSHLIVGDALDVFAPVLENAQAQADRALVDGRAAAEKLKSLQGALSMAETDFSGASQAAQQAQAETQKPDKDQVERAVRDADASKQALSAAQGRVNGAQQELDLAKQLAEQAKQLRDGGANTCKRDIEHASDVGIQPRSFWAKLADALKALWDIICEVAKWVALVAGIIGMILGGPLAWIALAAGAILLIKAIVDFSQGKGSVMDLVFGILGVIPGVKGLTTLSKLSALYKAGGVKEIAKATLTGMKNLAMGMVGTIKAAGTGALTLAKQIGDGSTAVFSAVKAAAVTLGDAVKVGAPKLGDVPPAKQLTGMPAPAGVATTTTKNFTDQFNDLAALKTQTETTEFAKIKTDFQNQAKTKQLEITNKFDTDLKVKTDGINQKFADDLAAGKLSAEQKFTNDLQLKTDGIKLDFDAKIDAKKLELTNAKNTELQQIHQTQINAEVTAIRGGQDVAANAKLAEMDAFAVKQVNNGFDPAIAKIEAAGGDASQFKVAKQEYIDNYTNTTRPQAIESMADAVVVKHTDAFNVEFNAFKNDLDQLKVPEMKTASDGFAATANADVAKATEDLGKIRDTEIADLTAKLDGVRVADIGTETAALEKIKVDDIKASDLKFDTDYQNAINVKQGEINTSFAGQESALNGQLLDHLSQTVPLPGGGSVEVMSYRPGTLLESDMALAVEKNIPDLKNINPDFGKFGPENNCTECVQKVHDYLAGNGAVAAPKMNIPAPGLGTIPSNFPTPMNYGGTWGDVAQIMQGRGDGAIGIVGFWPASGAPGHVFNVWNNNGRIAFLDGQTGKLGYVQPQMPGDTIGFLPTK